MGRLSASASSEKGFQTALAKSPPRWARPTTACWAPFMPPGSGAIRAIAATMRTIAQAPNPKRPSRAVSTMPAAACQTRRKPASTSTPALNTNSMSPTAEGRSAPRLLEEGEDVAGGPVGIGEQPAVDALRERRFGRRHGRESKTGESENEQDDQESQKSEGEPGPRPFRSGGAPRLAPADGGRGNSSRLRSTAADCTASATGRPSSGANRMRSGRMVLSWPPPRGWRGRAAGACPRRRAPGPPH